MLFACEVVPGMTWTLDFPARREALEIGAVAYVDKPFDAGYLKRVVVMAFREGF